MADTRHDDKTLGPAGSGGPKEEPQQRGTWTFVQSFGDDAASADDLVTAMDFSACGEWLAAGDAAGRVCLFRDRGSECGEGQGGGGGEAEENVEEEQQQDGGCGWEGEGGGEGPGMMSGVAGGGAAAPLPTLNYDFFYEFQSHDRGFDPLRSVPIEERVKAVRWVRAGPSSPSRVLLSCNAKTAKLWFVTGEGERRRAVCRRTFARAHVYDIHSVSVNSDGATFLSADDLRVNLWSLDDRSSTAYTVLDAKPAQLSALDEVITTAAFHPTDCGAMVCGTSGGRVRLFDLRARASLGAPAAVLLNRRGEATATRPFAAVAASVSDASYVGDHQMCTRDFGSVKMWDLRRAAEPLATSEVHPCMDPYLSELYENSCLFDPFAASASPSGERTVTGSYDNHVVVHEASTGQSTTIRAQDENDGPCTVVNAREQDALQMDLARKTLHTQWHPAKEAFACAAVNKIYVFECTR